MKKVARNKPYYPLGKIKQAIKDNAYYIDDNALQDAANDFGWKTEDIEKAFQKLRQKDYSHSVPHFVDPTIWVDHYRAFGLMGEDVYTHIHFEDDILQITSFKQK